MKMAIPNPYLQYRKQQINTAPQEKLLLMLFDGALRFCQQTLKALEEKDFEAAHTNLVKIQAILLELMISLNMDYEIAQNLYSLYDYLYSRLVEANFNKDKTAVEEVQGFLQELRETWSQAALKAKS